MHGINYIKKKQKIIVTDKIKFQNTSSLGSVITACTAILTIKKSASSPQFHVFLGFSEWRLIIFLQKLTTHVNNGETICFL
jgi:hypothetical protein